jgi:ATP-dependent protease HslVU (ClpYQ) peptidase subunit
MTVFVVVRKGNEVCIAADTLTSMGSTKHSETYKAEPPKITMAGGSCIGLIGSSAHRQVLERVCRKT